MSRSLNNPLAAVAVLTIIALATAEAAACGGGGRGGYRGGGRSYGFSRNISYAPRTTYHQPAVTAPVFTQPVTTQPAFGQPIGQQPIAQPQPALQQSIGQQAIAPQPTAAATQPAASAQQSALDALGSFGVTSTPAPQQTVAPHLGSWIATLPGDNKVQLRLNGDGTFRWIANSRGKESSFDGMFTVENGRLTLTRDGDNERLAGGWVSENGGFRFTLTGSKDNGLLFVRG